MWFVFSPAHQATKESGSLKLPIQRHSQPHLFVFILPSTFQPIIPIYLQNKERKLLEQFKSLAFERIVPRIPQEDALTCP